MQTSKKAIAVVAEWEMFLDCLTELRERLWVLKGRDKYSELLSKEREGEVVLYKGKEGTIDGWDFTDESGATT